MAGICMDMVFLQCAHLHPLDAPGGMHVLRHVFHPADNPVLKAGIRVHMVFFLTADNLIRVAFLAMDMHGHILQGADQSPPLLCLRIAQIRMGMEIHIAVPADQSFPVIASRCMDMRRERTGQIRRPIRDDGRLFQAAVQIA